jgi:hypothetical protein
MGDDLLKLLNEKFLPWVRRQPAELAEVYHDKVHLFLCNAVIGTEVVYQLQINMLGELAIAKPDLAMLIIDFDEKLENIDGMAKGVKGFDPKQILAFLDAYKRMLSCCEKIAPGHIKIYNDIITPEKHSKMWYDLCNNYKDILNAELKDPDIERKNLEGCLENLDNTNFFIENAFQEYPPKLIFNVQIAEIKSNLNVNLGYLTKDFNVLTYMISQKEIDFKLLDSTLDSYKKVMTWHQRLLKSFEVKETGSQAIYTARE